MEEELPSFTDDILVEILSRLPVRSLCRFKCVSRSWHDLISHPHHRKKLPQTLAGFFYESFSRERSPLRALHFTNVTGKGSPFVFPSSSFFTNVTNGSDVILVDSCGGLLLFCCFLQAAGAGPRRDPFLFHGFRPGPRDGAELPPFRYAVCNPATDKRVMLPEGSWATGEPRTARLCFDPTVSPHFSVIEYVVDSEYPLTRDYIQRLEIYSSKTGSWSSVENGWGDDELILSISQRSVFLNGFLHSVTLSDDIAAVDMEGKTWRRILVPVRSKSECAFIDQSQGHLCLINVHEDDSFKLSIWTLEGCATDEWILKHTVSTLHLFGGKRLRFDMGYKVIAIHPEGNVIFFVVGPDKTLMAYRMDRRQVCVIRNLGPDCLAPYLPYIPLFGESPVDRQ